jgi:peptidoglycan-associated lipoprotein
MRGWTITLAMGMCAACSHEAKVVKTAAAAPVVAPSALPAPAPTARAAPTDRGDDGTHDGRVYFDFDSSLLRQGDTPRLQSLAKQARQKPRVHIRIEGNCDERGTAEYNLALGAQRAESAKRYLVHLGVSPAQIDTVSYGEEHPVAEGHEESAWQKNRRDDVHMQ